MSNDVPTAVRALLPDIAERAATIDETRRVPDTVVDALASTGVFRMLQPRRYGGAETEPVRFYEVVREVSAACGSTGWITRCSASTRGTSRCSTTVPSTTYGVTTRRRS